jgi:hypothetical protein
MDRSKLLGWYICCCANNINIQAFRWWRSLPGHKAKAYSAGELQCAAILQASENKCGLRGMAMWIRDSTMNWRIEGLEIAVVHYRHAVHFDRNIKESLKLRMIFSPFHMTRSITFHNMYPWLMWSEMCNATIISHIKWICSHVHIIMGTTTLSVWTKQSHLEIR